jgi:hypothetical protein
MKRFKISVLFARLNTSFKTIIETYFMLIFIAFLNILVTNRCLENESARKEATRETRKARRSSRESETRLTEEKHRTH